MDNFNVDLFRDKKYYDEACNFIDLMNFLNSLNDENIEEIIYHINTSNISTSKEYQKRFVRTIFNLMRFRPDLALSLVTLCSRLTFNETLKTIILKEIFLSDKLSYCHFYFFRLCIQSNFLKKHSFVQMISKYYSKKIEQTENYLKFRPVFLWFLKEIHQDLSDLYEDFLDKIEQKNEKEFILYHIKELQKHNFRLFDQLTNSQFESFTPENAIKNDDLNAFDPFAIKDPNQSCNLTLFDLFLKPNQHPTFFQLSCLYSSIKCNKFLILHHANISQINHQLNYDHLKPKITNEEEDSDCSSNDDVEEIIVHKSNDQSSSESNDSDVQIDEEKQVIPLNSDYKNADLDDEKVDTFNGLFQYGSTSKFLNKLGINCSKYSKHSETTSSDDGQRQDSNDVVLIESTLASRQNRIVKTESTIEEIYTESTSEEEKQIQNNDNKASESNNKDESLNNNNNSDEQQSYVIDDETANLYLNPENNQIIRERCHSDEYDDDYDDDDMLDYLKQKEEENSSSQSSSFSSKSKKKSYVKKKDYIQKISQLTETSQYAVAGGNLEIVRYLHDRDLSFQDTARIAICYFRNDMFYWLIEHCQKDILLSKKSIVLTIGDHLFAAIISGNIEIVKYILFNYQIDINTNSCCNHIPIHLAIEYHQYDIVKILLGLRKLNINVEDRHRKTPYLKAIEERSTMIMKEIENHPNFEPNHIAYDLFRPVHFAAFHGNDNVMKRVLDIPCVEINDNLYETPIVFAIKANNFQTYNVLKHNPFIDFNVVCHTMFLFALIEQDWETQFKMMIENRAVDVNIVNKEGLTPLLFAISKKKRAFINLLINSTRVDISAQTVYDENNCLHFAAIHDDVLTFQQLHGHLSINSKNAALRTPLHLAVINNSIKVCKYLINQSNSPNQRVNRILKPRYTSEKLDVNAIDELGKTALHYAAQSNSSQIIEILLEHPDISLAIKDHRGNTPFHSSLEKYGYGLNLFIKHPTARISEISNNGLTLFHYSVKRNLPAFLSELIAVNQKRLKQFFKHGNQFADESFSKLDIIDINLPDENGFTALHYCCCLKNIEILNAILDYFSFLHELSFKYSNTAILPSLSKLDHNSRNPFHYAAQGKNSKVGLHSTTELELSKDYCKIYENRIENAKIFQEECNIEVKSYSPVFISRFMDYFLTYMDYSSILNDQDSDGNTFFHLALLEPSFDGNILIEHCRQIDCVNGIGETYLHLAVLGGHINVVTFLCQKCKFMVNSQTTDGNTPVHYAARIKNKEILQILSTMKKIDFSIKNKLNQKAFDLIEPGKKDDFLLYFIRVA